MCSIQQQQALTRSRFDTFHQIDDNRISAYSCNYYTNSPSINCPNNYPANATVRLQKNGNSYPTGLWKTEVETDLRGANRLSSRIRCSEQHDPRTNKITNTPLTNLTDGIVVPLTFTKLQDPPCTLRGTGWNRWTPLFHNPQETFETPFDFFIPSRSIDKERYKTS